MNTKPKKWIAAVLGFMAAPLAFLYVKAPRWAAASLAVGMAIGVAGFMLPGRDSNLLFSLLSVGTALAWAVYAYRLAARAVDSDVRLWYSRWYGLIGGFLAFAVAALCVRAFFYEPYRAPSSSMMPNVPMGSNLIVKKWRYGHYGTYAIRLGSGDIAAPLERGDIIAFDYPRDPTQTYIKRLVGLPGDKIVYRDKHLLLNGVDVLGAQTGEYLDPEYLVYHARYREKLGNVSYDVLLNSNAPAWAGDSAYKLPKQCAIEHETIQCEVPAGSYFVLGDNRDNSADSRFWGFVPAALVVGKVVAVIPPRG